MLKFLFSRVFMKNKFKESCMTLILHLLIKKEANPTVIELFNWLNPAL